MTVGRTPAVVLRKARARISAAQVPQHISDALAEASELLLGSKWSAVDVRPLYSSWASLLLSTVLPQWGAALPSSVRQASLDRWFTGDSAAIPPGAALLCILEQMRAMARHRHEGQEAAPLAGEVQTVFGLLEGALLLFFDEGKGGLQKVLLADDHGEAGLRPGSPVAWATLLPLLSSLPERVSNLARGRSGLRRPALEPAAWHTRLCGATLETSLRHPSPVTHQRVAELLGKISLAGQAEVAAAAFLHHTTHGGEESNSRSLLDRLPETALEPFLCAWLGRIRGPEGTRLLDAGFGPAFEARGTLRYLVTAKLLTRRLVPPAGLRCLLRNFLDRPDRALLHEACGALAGAFQEPELSAASNPRQHLQVISSLSLCLEGLSAPELQGDPAAGTSGVLGGAVLHGVIAGVQAHMGSSLERTREHGMRVALSLSRVLTPDSPIDFGGLLQEEGGGGGGGPVPRGPVL